MNKALQDLVLTPQMLDRVVAEQCRRSFFRFVQEFWETIIPEPPVWNWHIEFLCNEAQQVMERVAKRLPREWDVVVINVPPGSTKSTIFTVMLPAWAWTLDPTLRGICGSYSSPLSIDLASRSRDVITSEKFKRLFPEVVLREDTHGKIHFKNTLGGDRYATSVGGSVTGMHGHFIVVDDPINPLDAEALSATHLNSANSWLDKTLSTRMVDKTITVTFLVMQRLHEDDPTGHVLSQGESGDLRVRHICLPAELEEPGTQPKRVLPEKCRAKYRDRLLDPVRLPREELARLRIKLGSFGYSGQLDQSPVPLEGGLFKVEHFRLLEVLDWTQVTSAVRYWDKAASEGAGAYTVGVLMCRLKDRSFVVADVVRGQWGALARDQEMLKTAQKDGRKVNIWIEQEAGGGGKSDAEASIRLLAGYTVNKETHATAKELRALPYASQVEAGSVALLRRPWTKAYIDEHGNFPNGKFKDQVDASSGAFNRLVGSGGLTW